MTADYPQSSSWACNLFVILETLKPSIGCYDWMWAIGMLPLRTNFQKLENNANKNFIYLPLDKDTYSFKSIFVFNCIVSKLVSTTIELVDGMLMTNWDSLDSLLEVHSTGRFMFDLVLRIKIFKCFTYSFKDSKINQ